MFALDVHVVEARATSADRDHGRLLAHGQIPALVRRLHDLAIRPYELHIAGGAAECRRVAVEELVDEWGSPALEADATSGSARRRSAETVGAASREARCHGRHAVAERVVYLATQLSANRDVGK